MTRWTLEILHDPKYLIPRELWYYNPLRSCSLFISIFNNSINPTHARSHEAMGKVWINGLPSGGWNVDLNKRLKTHLLRGCNVSLSRVLGCALKIRETLNPKLQNKRFWESFLGFVDGLF